MNELTNLLSEIISNPFGSLLIIITICFLEILLSVDNAAVLATMVMDLPIRLSPLHTGIFRGLA